MPFDHNPSVEVESWPAELRPAIQTLHLQRNTSRFESPFTRTVQTQELPGGRFVLQVSFGALEQQLHRKFRAFIARLRGSAGRFFFRAEIESGIIPAFGRPEATSLVKLGADSTRFTADRTDITIDATRTVGQTVARVVLVENNTSIIASCKETVGSVVMEAGRHFSFDTPEPWRSLHVLTEDAVVTPQMEIHLKFEPPIRTAPRINAWLHINSPSGVFMLEDDDQGSVTIEPGRVASPSLSAIEAFVPRFRL